METLIELIGNFLLLLGDELFFRTEYNKKKKGKYALACFVYFINLALLSLIGFLFILSLRLSQIDNFSLNTLWLVIILLALLACMVWQTYHYTRHIWKLTKFFFGKEK
ncbi:hypothetical protein [Vagococcus xieshaowenii]|uniref:Uncharacterized protein n=1 Tax=Vagococcus xieshaowenii TaxID=2562451 RepID=A0AAJ5EDY3_9ENTE|nr:hypothetical protein [Vagococcus xieshaowenii]QCA29182.1 hypothetical protein E4Z98_07580 [Vagococcus xieshaowenii]TFZ40840.1 hypothetical protein E4031_05510 [Vagococcus xieshaowenii]